MRVDLVAEAHMGSERHLGETVRRLVAIMAAFLLERLRTLDLEDQH